MSQLERGSLTPIHSRETLGQTTSTPQAKIWDSEHNTPTTPRTSTSADDGGYGTPFTPPDIHRSIEQPWRSEINILTSKSIAAISLDEHSVNKLSDSAGVLDCSHILPGPGFHMPKKIASGQWSNVFFAEIDQKSRGTSSAQDVLMFDSGQACASGCYKISPLSETSLSFSNIDNISRMKRSKSIAIKVPSNKMAQKTLAREASIHSRLESISNAHQFVVDFFGYDMHTSGLILEYIPLQLDSFPNTVESTVLNISDLSRKLVDGLAFLHRADLIHGDIKPSNILIRYDVLQDTLTPIYCDFSASYFDGSDQNTLDAAGTYDYMAPELFSNSSQPSKASDVYALALTLIFATIGRGVYAHAPNLFSLRAMAMQGTPLDFLAADHVALHKFDSSELRDVLVGALHKNPSMRWSSGEWKATLEQRV